MRAESSGSTRHPFVSLIVLLLWVFVGMILPVLLIGLFFFFVYGLDGLISIQTRLSGDIGFFKALQFFTSITTFIIPAIIFVRQESSNPISYLNLNKKLTLFYLISAVVIYFAFVPFIEWTIVQNSHMKLPVFLKGLEDWMKQKEDEMAVLTKQFLIMKSPSDLLINLIVIAIIPGIGEELIFRGCLQKIFIRWTNNYHIGIWLAAIIFSAIHVQFYGFIPRMLLGALFGYIYYWSKNLMLPMIAHSINNGTAVIGAYVLQKNGGSLDKIDQQSSYPLYVAILSLIIGIILLVAFKRQLSVNEVLDEE